MSTSSSDCIQNEISLRAPLSRVWQAITDPAEFGEWFGVDLDGVFRVGEKIQGQITHPGCEHMIFEAWVERMDAEQSFAFRWHPQDIDSDVDSASEPSTLVEFLLQETGDGTLLTVTESGFDALPEARRGIAFERNETGWSQQMESIRSHVEG